MMKPLNSKTNAFKSSYIIAFRFIIPLYILFATTLSYATPEYSCQTGESCIFCHENPEGGDILSSAGEEFLLGDYSFAEDSKPFFWNRIIRLILGFLHILFAVIWFGAIFYIHLFVKPASLTSGLPRNERILGWICILVVGITGTLLSIFRIRSLNELWTTTFGIIWLVKVVIFLIMVIIATIATTRLNRLMREAHIKRKERVSSTPDGGDGKASHFIYNGDLYDVSNSKLWKNGIHMGRHYAGTDLTSAMSGAPHGDEILERISKVGSASDLDEDERVPAVKQFIFMAYFILFCMLGVIFCVAYWNWGPALISTSVG